MNKLLFSSIILCGGIFVASSMDQVSAHGYVANPPSRVVLGQENGFQWNTGVDTILNNPQGIEAATELLDTGALNGKLASAGKDEYKSLDVQNSQRWVKNDMTTGENQITWHHTAIHKTNRHRYYMTKQGWDQNAPLTLDSMELIGVVGQPIGQDLPPAEGPKPSEDETHTITIPKDRSGYHVIYAVWDINDTINSFYQAIDVNIVGDDVIQTDTTAPTVPGSLKADNVGDSHVSLSWNPSIDTESGVKEYQILRDGKLAGTSKTASFNDLNVKSETEYAYTIKAVDNAGNISEESEKLTITTLKEESSITERPTVPTNLHSMGASEDSVSLMWGASSHSEGIKGYQIIRDGVKIAETTDTSYEDTGLSASTQYQYTVKAVAKNGTVSESSNILEITTEGVTTPEKPEVTEGNWDKGTIYYEGDVVTFNGATYQAKYWTQGNQPDEHEAWKLIEGTQTWSVKKAYDGGEQVEYKGHTYQAAYWVKGEIPTESSIWSLIK